MVLQELWTENFPTSPITLSYTEWLTSCLLVSFAVFVVITVFINLWFLGFSCNSDKDEEMRVKNLIRRKWDALGKIRQEEIIVFVCFVSLILFWFFRDPGDVYKLLFLIQIVLFLRFHKWLGNFVSRTHFHFRWSHSDFVNVLNKNLKIK